MAAHPAPATGRERRLPEDMPMPDPEHIDPRRAALIAYDVCRPRCPRRIPRGTLRCARCSTPGCG